MLVLDQDGDVFADHSDLGIRYRLPTGLKPVSHGEGLPQVLISRGEDGGVLQVRLTAEWPDLAPGERAVPFAGSRFRLAMRTPGGGVDAGAWRSSPVTGDILVDRSVSLEPSEAAIARRLGTMGGELVDVEVELAIRGLSPTYPWTAYALGGGLLQTLRALVGSEPVTWTEIEGAFLGLGPDTFTWRASEPGALPPPDSAKAALARHAAPYLLDQTPDGWSLRAEAPERLAFSLSAPVSRSRNVGLRWSLSEFLAAQLDPSKHLVDISVPAPFEATEVIVANDVPLAAQGVRRIEVEIETGGPSGRLRHVFLPGATSAARLAFVRETFEELSLRWKASVTVMTARGPAIVENPSRPAGLSIQIDSKALGLVPVRLRAEPELFDHLASVECVVGTRRVPLTAAAREAWLVGRKPPATAEVFGKDHAGATVSLGVLSLGDGLSIDGSILGLGEPVRMSFSVSDAMWAGLAYLAVQWESGGWRTLEPGSTLSCNVRRESRLRPPTLRYRTCFVRRGADGSTRPLVESEWRSASGESVEVEV